MTSTLAHAPELSAIIVSYNTREMTLKCLRILIGQLGGMETEIFVVDNGSQDGSADAVRAAFPQVTVIPNPKNAGFGAANNLALKEAKGRYLLLLNSDAFPREGAISGLVAFLENNPRVGVVGPRLLNEDGSMQTSCYRFTTPAVAWLENLGLTRLFSPESRFGNFQRWDHASQKDVDFVIGACLVLRREVYEQVGGFDETFFMYQEEADWQKRIQAAGWRVVFTPTVEVEHLAGGSGKDQPVKISHYFFESLDIFMLKHHGFGGFVLVRMAMLIGSAARALGWSLLSLLPRFRSRASQRLRLYTWLLRRQLFTGRPVPTLA